MENAELQGLAFQHLTKRLDRAGVADGVLRLCDQDAVEGDTQSSDYVQFRATIVRPSTDFVVFYDADGRLTGWRDDGRLGVATRMPGNAAAARIKAMNDLGLPLKTRGGDHKAVELPPIGWVTETVLFTDTGPDDDQVLKIWSNPETGLPVQWMAKAGQGPKRAGGPALQEHAATLITDVLTRRLSAIVTSIQPKWYFLIRAQDPEDIPRGFQVRVNTWRHWSDAWVTLDPSDGLVCGDRIDRLAEPASTEKMDRATALAAMQVFFEMPQDAVLDDLVSEEIAQGHFVDTLMLSRRVNGLRVDGDFIEVSLHPTTQQLVRHDYQWRPVFDVSAAPRISQDDAIRRVQGLRADLNIDPDLQFTEAELALVPNRVDGQPTTDPERPKAWCLTYEADWGYVVVQVNAATGDIVHIHRSG